MHQRYRILRRRLLGFLGAPVRPEPVSIDIEPTVRCNLRCAFCQRASWHRSAPDMTPKLFRHILDSFPGLDAIKLQGMGEPLLNQDLFAMIRMARQRGIRVKTYTNGALLSAENAARLAGAGIDEIFVSFDHPDPEVLEALRPGLKFGEFCAGVERLVKAAQKGSPRVSAWALAVPQLRGQVLAHVAKARELGLRAVTYQLDLTAWGESPSGDAARGRMEWKEEIAAAARAAPGMTVTAVATNSFTIANPCPWPFYHCYVTAEGRLQPCCVLSDPAKLSMGDLTQTPLYRLWNGPAYFRFRKSITANRLLPWCRGCYRTITA